MNEVSDIMTSITAYDLAAEVYTRIRNAKAYVSLLDIMGLIKQTKAYELKEDNDNLYLIFVIEKGKVKK